jgi:hypothetical protein
MSVLCLDIATTTGWALWGSTFAAPRSGFVYFKSEETNGHRLLNFWRFLNIPRNIDCIYYEKPGSFQGRGHANKVVPHLIGVLELWAALHEVPLEGVSPSTLKKFATGRGNKVSKNQMLQAACCMWSRQVQDHNEADALVLLAYAMKLNDYQPACLTFPSTASAV